ncbi:adenylate kinase 3 [Aspergillus nomiae NRRL 13137]|uniref:Adenylate kinase 3 n=1 Tax=Aspergillus nomiae NRRL (strain ATCC 15546 / NRRL 13137 / CBS 260.88 / M93) TaxID=1509407 RepID=A0A0L1JAH0_ASPN3|nr:adenylate kinase 3 [Aspergillus nomiae NRRL 13137]KNG88700.1 adenylate kinase 3 [Aspergillus nomiae NRRL 13137]
MANTLLCCLLQSFMTVFSQLLLNVFKYPVSKIIVVRRFWSAVPFSGLREVCIRIYNKSACHQDTATIPLGAKPISDPEQNRKVATVVFLIGGPGSGKSTIATRLAADLGLIHLDPDEIISRLGIAGPDEWLAVKSTMDENGTVPDYIVSLLLKIEISKHLNAHQSVFLIEAFPRSYAQFMEFTSICGYGLTISLDVSSATLMRRFMLETKSFSEKVAQMEDFLKREDTFAGAELALYPHADFTNGLVKVCAELKVEEFYPHLKDLVARRLASPKTALWVNELGMEMVSSVDHFES